MAMTYYVPIEDIRMPFRKALAEDPNITTYIDHVDIMEQLGRYNNCRIVGSAYIVTDPDTKKVKRTWFTDGIEFPDEASLMWFKLRWS